MLRPATPLSIIFLAAFVLLLLSTLSTPVIKGIPLGSFQGYNLGVLGYCKGDTCEGPRIGYSTDGLFSGGDTDSDWSLPASTRSSLSSILIVHPVAALLTLICFGLAVAAHFHGPSHSPRFLLALLILTFPTLLVTLLAFLVDILLFIPHMAWGGWIVLAATILIVGSSIVTCAMRRTLVSRKARKKRIEEDADMNGQNYYENLHQQRVMAAESLPKADSPPPMSGSTAVDKGAQFGAFEMKRHDTHESQVQSGSGMSMDDRTPLNPTRDPSIRSASSNGGRMPYGRDENAPPMPMGRSSNDHPNGMPRRPSRDQYGNPLPLGAEMGMALAPGLRHQNSQGSLGSNRSNGYAGGRGGHGPPPRGYGPPRGGYGPPRGAYGPPRGAYGPRGGRGGYGPPPPGFNGRGRGYGPPPGMMGRAGPMPRAGPPPGPPGYDLDPYYAGATRNGPAPQMNHPPPPSDAQFLAGTIGQAIEMDERTGSPQVSPTHQDSHQYGLRDSDVDVAGMVGLQQRGDHQSPPPGSVRQESHRSEPRSPASIYSDQYVPPRANWSAVPAPLDQNQQQQPGLRATMETTSSDPQSYATAPSSRAPPLSPVPASPTLSSPGHAANGARHHRSNSENYYEDVDPRFAADAPPLPPPVAAEQYHAIDSNPHANRQSGIPHALTPGPGQFTGRMQSPPPTQNIPPSNYLNPDAYAAGGHGPANHSNSSSSLALEQYRPHSDNSQGLEPIPDGARSPGGSEASHFTSVSQRPVNPNWRPGPGMAPPGMASTLGGSSASAAQRRKEDVILNANPDFSLPGVGLPGRGRGRGRGGAASLRGGPMAAATSGLTPDSRYPTPL
ncbi:pH-response regulator palI RIM9 [Lecanosticta acicola]|uniref:PH-response regulator palI RIM9 n=1 Tax=Lecanosticta acicola TaxID=111012 RepID=A0AAI8YRL7_9PEZI|nr:pH-response regulator palI RIM9 [Lecanosticta acicola]